MTIRRHPLIGLLGLLTLAVAGCGGGQAQPSAPTTASRDSASPATGESPPATPMESQIARLPSHDPPLDFRRTLSTSALAHEVVGDLLYTVTSDWEATTWEMATGTELSAVPLLLPAEFPGLSDNPPFAFTSIGGGLAVVTAYEYEVAGTGSEPDRTMVRVQAHFADTGFRAWSQDLDVAGPIRISATNRDYTIFVGIDATHVLQTETGRLLHEWEPFTAYAIDGDIAVGWYDTGRKSGGISSPRIIGLEGRSLRDGETAWSREIAGRPNLDGENTYPLGDGLIFHATGGGYVIEAETGQTLLNVVDDVGEEYDGYPVQRFLHCGYDGDSVLACSGSGGEFLATWDLDRRERLWTIGEIRGDRILSARYSSVYHGALYMSSAGDDRRPLVLDARTGDDLAPGIPEEMHEVGRGYGIHVPLHSSGRPVLQGNGDKYPLETYRSTG